MTKLLNINGFLVGAVVGAFMSVLLPEWLLVTSLVLLLAFTTWTTLEKGISQFQKESKEHALEEKSALARAAENQLELQVLEESKGLLDDSDDKEGEDSNNSESNKISSQNSTSVKEDNKTERAEDSELAALLEEEKSTPFDKAAILSFMVVVVIVLNLLKGGSGKHSFPSPLGFKCGSSGYWLLTASVIVFVVSISLWMRSILVEKWKLKKRIGYKFLPGDMEWNEQNTIVYPLMCFFAGFFAG